jgi:hypothetical protein
VPITTKVESSNHVHGEVYPLQHYMIKLVNDLRQVCGFLGVLRLSSTNKTDRHDITEILLKVALNTITLTLTSVYKITYTYCSSILHKRGLVHKDT